MDNLLKTKLIAPALRVDTLKRTHLLSKLEDGFLKGVSVFLVTAPAGYGKSMLVSSWLKFTEKTYTWLSLEEKDNNPIRFLDYLIAAFRKIHANIGISAENLLGSPKLPPIELLMNTLINDIIDSNEEFLLVLEDFHLLNNEYILDTIRYLINNKPETLKIGIISRNNPHLSLNKLRASNKLIEIKQNELRFSNAEVKTFFCKVIDINISSKNIELLTEKLEGWPVGLQLTGLSLKTKSQHSIDMSIERLALRNRYIFEYLFDEVINQIDDELKNFLIMTSDLERFSVSLCDYIMEIDNSNKLLEKLYEKNIFLISIDTEREWFRYHHCFSAVLKNQLMDGVRYEIHKKASMWYEDNGFIIEALDEAALIDDKKRIEQLLIKITEQLFVNCEIATYLKYSNYLTGEQILNNLMLCTYRAWAFFLLGCPIECNRLLDQLETSQILKNDDVFLGSFLALKATILFIGKDVEAFDFVRNALKLVENKNSIVEFLAFAAYGNGISILGGSESAIKITKKAFEIIPEGKFSFMRIIALLNYSGQLTLAGKSKEAVKICESFLKDNIDNWGRQMPMAKLAYIPLATAYFYAGEFDKSKEYIENAIPIYRSFFIVPIIGDMEEKLAKILFLKGKKQEAYKIIDETLSIVTKIDYKWAQVLFTSLKAEFALWEGRINEASCYINSEIMTADNILDDKIYLTKVRILIAEKNFGEANELLDFIEKNICKSGRYMYLVNIHIQRSIICKLQLNEGKAIDYISEALKKSDGDEYVQPFLDDYLIISDLLAKCKAITPDLVKKIEQRTIVNFNYKSSHPKVTKMRSFEEGRILIEDLSNREKEILYLITQGYSNEEIARKLFITIGTTKWHISNIFRKFGVNSRSKAIVRAQELKLV